MEPWRWPDDIPADELLVLGPRMIANTPRFWKFQVYEDGEYYYLTLLETVRVNIFQAHAINVFY